MLKIRIKSVSGIAPGLTTQAHWQQFSANPVFAQTEVEVPKLSFVPAMQRRRLSPFARLCCYSLNQLTERNDIATVFATRCGDLEKTDQLIVDACQKQPLSPTQFGLSVHNAVAGQYSIFTENKQPSTTISASHDTFHFAIIDAQTRLMQSSDDEIAVVCTDVAVPEKYTGYMKEQQVNYSVALLLSKREGRELSLQQNAATQEYQPPQNTLPLPQALQFMAWYFNQQAALSITSDTHQWLWRHV